MGASGLAREDDSDGAGTPDFSRRRAPSERGEAPPRAAIEAFQRTLENRGVSVTLRESKGKGVDAACGQLRRRTDARG